MSGASISANTSACEHGLHACHFVECSVQNRRSGPGFTGAWGSPGPGRLVARRVLGFPMKQGLSLRISQHLALTPQLQHSIRLLQLSTLELSQEV